MPKLKNEAHEQFAKTYALDPQKRFNGTKAYKESYPEAKETSARALAPNLLANVSVKNRISELLDQQGLSVTHLNDKLRSLTDAKSEDVQLRATRLGYELHGVLDKDQNMNNHQNIQVNILQINNNIEANDTQPIDTPQDTDVKS